MAICDSNYKFIYASFGNYGSASDGGIFDRSDLKKKLDSGNLRIPEPRQLPNSNITLPFYFLGDAAFPFLPNLMKPYPGDNLEKQKRLFNYR